MQPTYRDLLQEVQRFWTPLPDKPEETPEGLLCALWSTACGAPISAERAVSRSAPAQLPTLDTAAYERLIELLERKKAGVPLAHLTERQSFLGVELLAGPAALIPRKETEILGRAALAVLLGIDPGQKDITVLDVCTGSGNLALAYAFHEPRARVYAADLSQEAVDL